MWYNLDMSANGKTPFLTPQQELFLSYYINPKSETFANAYASAIKAKYEDSYARNISGEMPDWMRENLGDMQMLRKAERVLDKTLEDDYAVQPVFVEGEEVGEQVNPALSKIQQDSAKFIAERLNKQKYSTRQEHTGKDGGAIEFTDKSDAELAKLAGIEI